MGRRRLLGAAAFAEANGLPVACAFRNQDLFDNRHRHYAGDVGIGVNPRLAARMRDADVLLVIGERLGEITTSGYTLIDVPRPSSGSFTCMPSRGELGRVYQPALADRGDTGRIPRRDESRAAASRGRMARERRVRARRMRRLARRAARPRRARHVPGGRPGSTRICPTTRFSPTARATTPCGSTASTGTGAFARNSGPYSGAMGYGVPAAVAAKAVHPERMVVSWNGDGCFLMNGQELATAVQYGLAVIFVVVDNGMYGTIRMHQERTIRRASRAPIS